MSSLEIHPAPPPAPATSSDPEKAPAFATADPTASGTGPGAHVAPGSQHNVEISRPHSRASGDSLEVVEKARDRDLRPQKDFRVDPFSQHREGNDDFVEFRTMGWFAAGLVSTAEVSARDV
jgi:hypothetical protein